MTEPYAGPAWYVPEDGRTAALRTDDGTVLATMRLNDAGAWDVHTPGGGPIALGCPSRDDAQARAHEAGYGRGRRGGKS